MRHRFLAGGACALALVLAAVAAAAAVTAPIEVVATSSDLKSLVEVVGRDLVRATSLVPPVHDPHPHVVDVKPGQVAQLRSAALLVRSGLDDEPWLARVLQAVSEPRLERRSPAVLDCSKGIALLSTDAPRSREEHGPHDAGNPHYLLDPDNARPVTAAIRDALARIAPAHRERFDTNRTGFLALLDTRLVRWSEALAPYRGSRVVLMHETWPYLARRFGLVVVGAVEPAPGVSPTPAYLADLVKRMKESGAKLVIGGLESNDAMLRLVAAQGGARPVTLISSVGGDPEARSYVALFDVNVKRLAAALAAR